nr:ABC transporter permease [Bacillus subtilis]WGD71053.1 ABC transporter permease [Bacillus subtilis]WGD76353.1 ABC transporter permease [Bacillus subtilis]WGD87222.1 ABC transporter permease [Bacillus subtilis]WGD92741.1 ABC transporter permease [Bacillus subtilis]
MIAKLLKSEILKIRNLTWLIVILGPLGVVVMQATNYTMRFDYLMSKSSDKWMFLLENIHSYWPSALLLEITIVNSLLAGIEHHGGMWKKIFSLPVSHWKVYQSKVIIIVTMLIISTVILAGGTFLLGKLIGFHETFPFGSTLKMSFYTFIAALPFVFMQFWLSINYRNQGIALTIGIASAVFIMYAQGLPDWMPWKWPMLIEGIGESILSVIKGLVFGLFLYSIIMVSLSRKDVA